MKITLLLFVVCSLGLFVLSEQKSCQNMPVDEATFNPLGFTSLSVINPWGNLRLSVSQDSSEKNFVLVLKSSNSELELQQTTTKQEIGFVVVPSQNYDADAAVTTSPAKVWKFLFNASFGSYLFSIAILCLLSVIPTKFNVYLVLLLGGALFIFGSPAVHAQSECVELEIILPQDYAYLTNQAAEVSSGIGTFKLSSKNATIPFPAKFRALMLVSGVSFPKLDRFEWFYDLQQMKEEIQYTYVNTSIPMRVVKDFAGSISIHQIQFDSTCFIAPTNRPIRPFVGNEYVPLGEDTVEGETCFRYRVYRSDFSQWEYCIKEDGTPVELIEGLDRFYFATFENGYSHSFETECNATVQEQGRKRVLACIKAITGFGSGCDCCKDAVSDAVNIIVSVGATVACSELGPYAAACAWAGSQLASNLCEETHCAELACKALSFC